LLDEVVGAAVPELAAARLELVLAFVLVPGEAERRTVGHVHDRRRLAVAELAGAAAEGDGGDRRAVIALKRALGVVARRAGLTLRLGEIGVFEKPLAEQLQIAQRAFVVRPRKTRRRVRLDLRRRGEGKKNGKQNRWRECASGGHWRLRAGGVKARCPVALIRNGAGAGQQKSYSFE